MPSSLLLHLVLLIKVRHLRYWSVDNLNSLALRATVESKSNAIDISFGSEVDDLYIAVLRPGGSEDYDLCITSFARAVNMKFFHGTCAACRNSPPFLSATPLV